MHFFFNYKRNLCVLISRPFTILLVSNRLLLSSAACMYTTPINPVFEFISKAWKFISKGSSSRTIRACYRSLQLKASDDISDNCEYVGVTNPLESM